MLLPKTNFNPTKCFGSTLHQDLRQFFAQPLCGAIESLLFAAEHSLTIEEIGHLLMAQDLHATREQIEDIVYTLASLFDQPGRGIQLMHIAGGWQFRTNPAYALLVRRMRDPRTPRFTQAALECLSVIAYRQPVTRAEIDAIRGVDSGGVLRTLIERTLIETAGRSEAPGRPYLYKTSPTFLEFFGLNDLQELPNLLSPPMALPHTEPTPAPPQEPNAM